MSGFVIVVLLITHKIFSAECLTGKYLNIILVSSNNIFSTRSKILFRHLLILPGKASVSGPGVCSEYYIQEYSG